MSDEHDRRRGQRILERRTQLGLGQEALARLVGVGHQTVWRWEAGRSEPKARYLTQLSVALDRSERWLETGTDHPLAATPTAPHPSGLRVADQVGLTGQYKERFLLDASTLARASDRTLLTLAMDYADMAAKAVLTRTGVPAEPVSPRT